jgi:hypothetical protein
LVASPSNLPPRVIEERRFARTRAFLGGKVVYDNGNSVRDCTIRDLSEKGAKVRLTRGECIPTRVFLIDRRSATAFESHVTWIEGVDFGLSFSNAYHLESDLPHELQYLIRIWKLVSTPLRGTPDC